MAGEIEVRPLTPERWDDFAALFGRNGACLGCWCSYWRVPRKEFDAIRGEEAKALMRARVEAGPPPGLLAYRDGEAVGWLQTGPRADTPQWNSPRRLSAPAPDAPAEDPGVWGATCFFVKAGHRRQGVTTALVAAAIEQARTAGARVLEACPMDSERRRDVTTMYVGSAGTFRRAGFREVARRKADRPLMRLEL